MEYEMRPVIDIYSLTDALEEKYHWGLESHEVCQLMFNDEYVNDSYKSYGYSQDEKYEGYPWQSESRIGFQNMIKQFLREAIPGHTRVLVDVSW